MTQKNKSSETEYGHHTWMDNGKIVRANKNIIVDPKRSTYIDRTIVRKRFCNALSFLKMPEDFKKVKFTIGITSPKGGEGKTLTAANLAVSLALAYKRKTVLVDMNFNNPSLHKVFGTKLRPGLVESCRNGSIFLSRTSIEQLYLLPAGRYKDYELGLNTMYPIRDIINSLEEEFEIVIVDLSSVLPIDDFPVACINNLDGLLVVIDCRKTKFADIDRLFKHIKQDQAIGFVMNNVEE